MKYPIEISTAPTKEPVVLGELKEFFREDRSVEDMIIQQFGRAARISIEKHTGFHLIDTVFKMYLDDFEDFKIPKKPFKSGSLSIEYIDEDEATQTLSSSLYAVHGQESPVSVEFFSGLPKLSDADGDKYPVIVTFTVGYGSSSLDVPDNWKSIIGLLAMIYWKRKIPEKGEDYNPLNLSYVRSLIQSQMIGRFK